jgi:hypothetical protein
VAGSVLTVAGLPELITSTFDEYVRLRKTACPEFGYASS